ncbi:hypothetical protein CRUP_017893 [Coryphaenoides rupestris]|nr:hypothetical protein CRUP_017893 [Coryphaenoides rupestris]
MTDIKPAAIMSSKRTKSKTTKKRPQRATSNVFAIPRSRSKNPSDEYLEGMMSEAPGPINFTMFLTMFGERLNGTDPEDDVDELFREAPIDKKGNFNYAEFTRILKHGAKDKDDE